jgi:hypothetical protein
MDKKTLDRIIEDLEIVRDRRTQINIENPVDNLKTIGYREGYSAAIEAVLDDLRNQIRLAK